MLICVCIRSPSAPHISRSLLPICLSLHSFSFLSAAQSLSEMSFSSGNMVTIKGSSALWGQDIFPPLLSVQYEECKANRHSSVRDYQLLNNLFRIWSAIRNKIHVLGKSALLYFKSGLCAHLLIRYWWYAGSRGYQNPIVLFSTVGKVLRGSLAVMCYRCLCSCLLFNKDQNNQNCWRAPWSGEV